MCGRADVSRRQTLQILRDEGYYCLLLVFLLTLDSCTRDNVVGALFPDVLRAADVLQCTAREQLYLMETLYQERETRA